jgi:hypothetical protein
MHDRKINNFESPDLNTLKAVVINSKTTIFIDKDKDPEEAIRRYEERYHRLNIKV